MGADEFVRRRWSPHIQERNFHVQVRACIAAKLVSGTERQEASRLYRPLALLPSQEGWYVERRCVAEIVGQVQFDWRIRRNRAA